MKTILKITLIALFLALGIQTQAQTLPPPNITNITFEQSGCLLDVHFDCSTCNDDLHMYYFDFITQRWIDIAVQQNFWPTTFDKTIHLPLCAMDTATYHTVGLLCYQNGNIYRITTIPDASYLSGAKAYITGSSGYSAYFFLPTITTPSCAVAPPASPTISEKKGKGNKPPGK